MKRLFLMLKVLIPLLMVPSYLYAYDFNVDGIFYNIVKDNTVSVTYQKNRVETPTYKGDLIIPSSVSYNNTSYIVTYIGNEAFRDCKNLTSVSIPNSVISIGDEAFWYCSGLSDMIIPNSVTSIGKKALANCSNLASVTISSNATSLENSTFWGCSSLTSVTIPNSITSIDNYAFYECCNLTSLVIGNSVTSIGSYAFSGCKNITSVNLPNSVTSIGVSAFANCSNLASVSIPNSVTFIGGESFQLCSSLTSITIPNSVTDIGGSAFSLCSGLTTIISEIEKPFRISESTFSEETYNNAELIIPKGTGKAYSSAGGWNFKHIVEAGGVTDYTLSIKSEGNGNASYDGETIRNITKSFTITEGSNATIEFNPDYGYRIKSVIINSVDITSSISNYQYTVNNISANITVEVEFEAIPITTYTLSVKAAGNGSATYDGTIARNDIKAFTLNEGSSAIITFAPDNGYRIKSVKVNGADVMSSLSNSSYTISNINANTIVEVEFEVIPIPTYTLLITATGNGSATYYGTTVKNNTRSFTLNEGSNATITFAPDNGYRIKSVKVNSVDVTSSVSNNSYTVSNIKDNTTVNVEFEAIPTTDTTPISGDKFEVDGITYVVNNDVNTVSVTSGSTNYSGNVVIPSQVIYEGKTYSVTSIGVMAFDGCSGLTSITIPESVKSIGDEAFKHCSGLTSITIPESVEGIGWRAFYGCGLTSITILGSPWIEEAFNGCPLTSVHISDLDKFLRIEYERPWEFNDPLNWAHHLFLNGEEIKDVVIPSTITKINDGALSGASSLTSVTIPNSVTSIGRLAFAGCSSLSSVVSEIENPYVISNTVFDGIPSDAKLIVPKGTKAAYQATEGWNLFANIVEAGDAEPDQPGQIHINDIHYKVTGSGEAEVVSAGNGVTSITIPSSVSYNNNVYKVTSIAKDAFENCDHLSAVIWEPDAQFNAKVNNPNFLLYVSDEKYASRSVKNVVVNGVAESIELTDAANGNDFYCPRVFSARNIVYSHNYQMETGIGDSRGWETIVLPFDVQKYTHATKGELESFTTWSKGSSKKPFWLFELTASGYKDVAGIKANTPYIISMPNNQQYEQQYQIPGVVTFSASDVEVKKSDNLIPANYQGKTFVPNYTNQNKLDFLALNVSNNYVTNPSKDIAGSRFIRGLRAVHPFEAYMTTTDNTRSIDVMEGMTTSIRGIQIVKDEASTIKVYDTRGVLMKTVTNKDDVRNGLKTGVYIVNGKKMVIK